MNRYYVSALLLTVTGGVLSCGVSFYGCRIAAAPSARAAAPLAAPFALFVSGSAASFVLAAVSVSSVSSRKRA